MIGRNGSGKSTLLQMLAGVTAPTEGRVPVRGRVAPLISVGVGFHPELTGRENVYVNGTILGLSRAEIDARFDEIVDFSEIGDFIDTPVKFYSSGMFVRLGFSVSALAEPDVLLVDEVLAVGDLAFQVKCFERIEALRDSDTTIVIVTHNLNAVRRLCDRTLVVHEGEIVYDGDTPDAMSTFHTLLAAPQKTGGPARSHTGAPPAPLVADLVDIELFDAASQPSRFLTTGEAAALGATIQFSGACDDPLIGVTVFNSSGVHVYADHWPLGDGTGFGAGDEVPVRIELATHLAAGSYSIHVGLMTLEGDYVAPPQSALTFYASGRDRIMGIADLEGRLVVDRSAR